jgi:hypothetical protein
VILISSKRDSAPERSILVECGEAPWQNYLI